MNLREIIFLIVIFAYMILLIYRTQFPIFTDSQAMKEELGGIKFGRDINLIPFKDFMNMTSVLNIAMFVPIGFLLGLIRGIKWKEIAIIGFVISLLIEVSQILVNVLVGYNFRISDVNDLIFNTIGTIVGLIVLYVIMYIVKKIFQADEAIVLKKILFGKTK
jgi:glycopeptide antibiotics resistance protein